MLSLLVFWPLNRSGGFNCSSSNQQQVSVRRVSQVSRTVLVPVPV